MPNQEIEMTPVVHNLRNGGYDEARIDHIINVANRLDKHMNDIKKNKSIADVEAKVAIVSGSFSSVADLVSTLQDGGNGYDIADKTMSVINDISQFAALAGPEGEVFAVAVSLVTSIVSTILNLCKPKEKSALEKLQDAITELINNKFDQLEFQEIKNRAVEEMGILQDNIPLLSDILANYSSSGDDFDSATKLHISGLLSKDNGTGAMALLRSYIAENTVPTKEKCYYVANALLLYSLLAHYRMLELSLFQACFLWKNWSTHEHDISLKAQKRVQDECKDVINLVPYYNKVPGVTVENMDLKHFFAGFYSLGNKKIETILNICAPDADRRYMGKTVTIAAKTSYLACSSSEAERAPVTKGGGTISLQNLFVIFDLRSIYGDDFVRIFSVGASGYLFASDAQRVPFLDNRHVCAWTPGNFVSNGHWQIDTFKGFGKTIKNKGFGEFLSVANDGDSKPWVFTYAVFSEEIASGRLFSGDDFMQVMTIKEFGV